jgi:hypothetical protein
VFLFTRDDRLKGKVEQAAPRDNVAKMPADLGGVIYEALADKGDVDDLEERLRLFLETSIWSWRGQPSAPADAERRGR